MGAVLQNKSRRPKQVVNLLTPAYVLCFVTAPHDLLPARYDEFISRRQRMDDAIRPRSSGTLPRLEIPPRKYQVCFVAPSPDVDLHPRPLPHHRPQVFDGSPLCGRCRGALASYKWTEAICVSCWREEQRRHQQGCICNFKHKPGCVGHTGLSILKGRYRAGERIYSLERGLL